MSDFAMWDMGADPVFQAQKNDATIAQLAAQTRGLHSSADLHDVQAVKALQDMQTADTMGRLAQARVAANPKAPLSELLSGLTLDAGTAGDAHMMAQLAGHASTALGHEAQAMAAGIASKKQALDLANHFNDTVHRWIGTAVDQGTFDRANEEIAKATGQPSPYQGQAYDPRFVQQARDASMSYKERIEAERKALADEERVRYHDAIIAVREQLAQIRENYNNIIREKNQAATTRKAEGKPIASPNKAQLDEALLYMKQNSPDLEGEDMVMAGTAMAEAARRIVQTRPGTTYSEALPEAYNLVKKDFTEQEKWGGLSKKLRFMGAGKTPLTAMTVPKDVGALVKGRYYDNGKGVIGLWDGKEFQPVTGE